MFFCFFPGLTNNFRTFLIIETVGRSVFVDVAIVCFSSTSRYMINAPHHPLAQLLASSFCVAAGWWACFSRFLLPKRSVPKTSRGRHTLPLFSNILNNPLPPSQSLTPRSEVWAGSALQYMFWTSSISSLSVLDHLWLLCKSRTGGRGRQRLVYNQSSFTVKEKSCSSLFHSVSSRNIRITLMFQNHSLIFLLSFSFLQEVKWSAVSFTWSRVE